MHFVMHVAFSFIWNVLYKQVLLCILSQCYWTINEVQKRNSDSLKWLGFFFLTSSSPQILSAKQAAGGKAKQVGPKMNLYTATYLTKYVTLSCVRGACWRASDEDPTRLQLDAEFWWTEPIVSPIRSNISGQAGVGNIKNALFRESGTGSCLQRVRHCDGSTLKKFLRPLRSCQTHQLSHHRPLKNFFILCNVVLL